MVLQNLFTQIKLNGKAGLKEEIYWLTRRQTSILHLFKFTVQKYFSSTFTKKTYIIQVFFSAM